MTSNLEGYASLGLSVKQLTNLMLLVPQVSTYKQLYVLVFCRKTQIRLLMISAIKPIYKNLTDSSWSEPKQSCMKLYQSNKTVS